MATKVILPLLGQTMEEGTINKWFKKEGDNVQKGEPLLEVMTDKVNMEVESPASGVVRKILALEEAVVPVKELIAIIGSPDENIDDLLASIIPVGAKEPVAGTAEEPTPPTVPEPTAIPMGAPTGRIIASPRAKKVAREHSLDIALLSGMGSGPGGRIVEKDVHDFLSKAGAKPRITPLAEKVAADLGLGLSGITGTGPGGKVTRDDVLRARPGFMPMEAPNIGAVIPFTGIRKAVADAVVRSVSSAAHVTLVSEVDMTDCARFREQINPEMERRFGVRISFTDIIVKAAARAIEDHRIINSTLEDDHIVIHDDVHIGVAVAIEGGLVAPVVKSVRSKPLQVISTEIKGLAEKARTGKLSPSEMEGGTFTITNLGTYGVDVFNPIINPPQTAILGVCRIVKKPVVVGDQIQIRSTMNLCLSFDHRVVDGAPAAQYLARVRELLENPYLTLI